MRIRCGYEIAYDCPTPTPMMLMLNVRPEREPDLASPQVMVNDRGAPMRTYIDGFGNVCTRVLAPEGHIVFSADFLIDDSGEPDPIMLDQPQHKVEDLPDETLVYLLGSRYCDTDRLSDLAWAEFGGTPEGGRRVQAIVEYAHNRVEFGYHHASSARTAYGAHEDQRGVCRDFAHLATTLCRCMNIPARYVTGYLGDIGIPPSDSPMDFSAWFQVFLGGEWRTFDARHNKPRIGRILMGHGRDATDVAITTTFGPAALVGFKVITEEV
jgi:transglutaminase-like putative cysteine protease